MIESGKWQALSPPNKVQTRRCLSIFSKDPDLSDCSRSVSGAGSSALGTNVDDTDFVVRRPWLSEGADMMQPIKLKLLTRPRLVTNVLLVLRLARPFLSSSAWDNMQRYPFPAIASHSNE
ncbi:hypothetical protein TGPRC2_288300 [Toxoplasma gondii TgCatPRC2]|uniref:Uncharacterized protein n=1 Tax=Toxoplasma gondii TgCatPRC2 TaxID=1130821 RepID=A0A151HJ80_TOXGO|nr:hypothetical protein TGPRC2_288300 [Toxoplasma gondii TgCatPRC2]